jgi:hypothetical protein
MTNPVMDVNEPELKAPVTMYAPLDLVMWIRQKGHEWGMNRSATMIRLIESARAREQEAAR